MELVTNSQCYFNSEQDEVNFVTVHSFSNIPVLFNFVNKTKVLKIIIGSFLLIVILIQM